MRYNTEQYSKSNSIELNRIESIRNKVEQNRIEWRTNQQKRKDERKEEII